MIRRFAAGGQPWMVEVHFPENPRGWPLRKYRERYDPRTIPVSPNFRDKFVNKPAIQKRDAETYGAMTEEDYREGRAFYYASFEQLDTQVGRLLSALEETGQSDRTLVIYAADHGAPWGAHHMWIPNFAPYEELYRIPMVMRWPDRIPKRASCDRLVQLHDIGHTLVDVLDLPPLPHPHGASLAPLWKEPARADWRDMILCPWYGQNFPMIQRMVITARHKYVFNAYDYDECYDLERDPYELQNIARDSSHATTVADMQARTYELMNRFHDPFGEKPGIPGSVRFLLQRYLPQGRRL